MQTRRFTRFDGSSEPRTIGPEEGKCIDLRSLGVRFLAWAHETESAFSLVEHPIPPRTLVAPLHRHALEDEYSFVLEGNMGAQLGEDIVIAGAGTFVFKPRHQWHTFWNAGDTLCRVLEIISPGGFESFFDELSDLMTAHNATNPGQVLGSSNLASRYQIEFRPETIATLCRLHGLRYPE